LDRGNRRSRSFLPSPPARGRAEARKSILFESTLPPPPSRERERERERDGKAASFRSSRGRARASSRSDSLASVFNPLSTTLVIWIYASRTKNCEARKRLPLSLFRSRSSEPLKASARDPHELLDAELKCMNRQSLFPRDLERRVKSARVTYAAESRETRARARISKRAFYELCQCHKKIARSVFVVNPLS